MSQKTLRCSVCREPTQREDNPHFPFCSDRCRMVDLDRWLSERYRISAPLTERNIAAGEGEGEEE